MDHPILRNLNLPLDFTVFKDFLSLIVKVLEKAQIQVFCLKILRPSLNFSLRIKETHFIKVNISRMISHQVKILAIVFKSHVINLKSCSFIFLTYSSSYEFQIYQPISLISISLSPID